MSLWPITSSAMDPFYDLTSDFSGLNPMMRGIAPMLGLDIANRFPRHVGSRVLQTNDGDLIWRPATDIYETESYIVVHCDLPGVPKNEINIDVFNEELVIEGTHKGVEGFESASSRVRERAIGRFRKIVHLPIGIDSQKVEAKVENGLLEIKVPKTQDFSHKRISLG